jgi:hypothetical protein
VTGPTADDAQSTEHEPPPALDRPTVYEVRIDGLLGPLWADAFEGLHIAPERDGHTLVTGPALDQAALYGLLRRIRDLGIPLISVTLVEGSPPDDPASDDEP